MAWQRSARIREAIGGVIEAWERYKDHTISHNQEFVNRADLALNEISAELVKTDHGFLRPNLATKLHIRAVLNEANEYLETVRSGDLTSNLDLELDMQNPMSRFNETLGRLKRLRESIGVMSFIVAD